MRYADGRFHYSCLLYTSFLRDFCHFIVYFALIFQNFRAKSPAAHILRFSPFQRRCV